MSCIRSDTVHDHETDVGTVLDMTQHKSLDKWVQSTGNVFEDLGFEGAEAAVLKIKADLMIELERAMRANDWNQTTAAEVLEVSRTRLNRMLHGRFEGVTIDKIVQMLERTGKCVTIKVITRKIAA